jgi:hypothetical protein
MLKLDLGVPFSWYITRLCIFFGVVLNPKGPSFSSDAYGSLSQKPMKILSPIVTPFSKISPELL